MNRIYLGRHVYGLAAVAFGIITLVWHDFNNWQQIRALGVDAKTISQIG
jgi:hypothetical protein